MLGIILYEENVWQQKPSFNMRNVWNGSMLSLAAISSSIQFFYVANSFSEYTNALYSASAMIAATIIFAIIVQRMRSLSGCLDNLECIVNERELS